MSYWLSGDAMHFMVPEAGLEPATPYGGQILSLLCKPFHHSGNRLIVKQKSLVNKNYEACLITK